MSESSLPPHDDAVPNDPAASEVRAEPAFSAHAVLSADSAPSGAVALDDGTASAAAPVEEPFAQELEVRAAPEPLPGVLAAGQRVRGKILSIGEEHAIVSLSGRPDAILATREFRTADGTLLLRVDDSVGAVVLTADVPIVLTLDKRRAILSAARLRIAHEQKNPVTGAVRALNRGGYEVRVAGVRCFCPLSQMDSRLGADPQSHANQTYSFRILRWENGGRSIILSRRAILKEEAAVKSTETRKNLEVGAEFDGVVTRVQPFGAFVDIGGLEGLLHVSRMGRGHVTDPAAIVAPGQPVRVKVTRIDDPGTRKERIALAATDLGPDPWTVLPETLRENSVLHGRVMRLTEFGAFVNLVPGIDGLVHVSELERRTESEGPPLELGQEIEIRVTRVDAEKRRVSLSLRLELPPPRAAMRDHASDDAHEARGPRPPRGASRPRHDRDRDRERDRDRGSRPNSETAPFADGGTLTHNMADQLGALKAKLRLPS